MINLKRGFCTPDTLKNANGFFFQTQYFLQIFHLRKHNILGLPGPKPKHLRTILLSLKSCFFRPTIQRIKRCYGLIKITCPPLFLTFHGPSNICFKALPYLLPSHFTGLRQQILFLRVTAFLLAPDAPDQIPLPVKHTIK